MCVLGVGGGGGNLGALDNNVSYRYLLSTHSMLGIHVSVLYSSINPQNNPYERQLMNILILQTMKLRLSRATSLVFGHKVG